MDHVDSERSRPSRRSATADGPGRAAAFEEPRSFAPPAQARPSLRQEVTLPPSPLPSRTGGAIIDLRPRVRPCAEPEAEDRVLVVISGPGTGNDLGALVAGVLADEGLVDPLVVAIDAGDAGGTRARLAALAATDPRVRLLTRDGGSPGAGVNLAVRLFGHGRAWLVRMDGGVDYPQHFVSRLIHEGRRTAASAVVVAMEARGEEGLERAAALACNAPLAIEAGAPAAASWVSHGRHALFRLTEFLKAGGYEEGFGAGEEAEFDLRLTRGGGRIWLTDAFIPRYRPTGDAGALLRQGFEQGRGRARMVLRRRSRLTGAEALALALAPAAAAAAAAPLFWPLALPAFGWAAVRLAHGAVLGLAARDRWSMLSGAVAMGTQLAWSAGFWSQLLARRRATDRLRPRRPQPLDASLPTY